MRINYNTIVVDIHSNERDLKAFRGIVLLIVNTASRCGYTPQYQGLQMLYNQYRNQGFSVLGFPCNQFGAQEPGDNQSIRKFCDTHYHVSFPVFSKIDVNGSNTHPLYQQLKAAQRGLLGTNSIKWNFTKFLIGADGTVLSRHSPSCQPKTLESFIIKALDTKFSA
ncbi:MAG: glutathione peroxidase [Acidiferrobacteraceae bacterium]|nr:glutathione peroxidase [Acidiferrobacteraceae bacterium]|tara:strand:- start:324 stop:821 length:498 start_codon:yes stop_codon:yes gene_type:complete